MSIKERLGARSKIDSDSLRDRGHGCKSGLETSFRFTPETGSGLTGSSCERCSCIGQRCCREPIEN